MSDWISVSDRLPEPYQRVLAKYEGVYTDRSVLFWRDGGGGPHFGYPEFGNGDGERDGKGSQPATHWRPVEKGQYDGQSGGPQVGTLHAERADELHQHRNEDKRQPGLGQHRKVHRWRDVLQRAKSLLER